MRWILICLATISAISITYGTEELIIQHSPKCVQFVDNHQELKGSQFLDVISAVFGFSSNDYFDWTGIKAGNPFKKPKAVAVVEFDGFSKVNMKLNKISYPFLQDMAPGQSSNLIIDRIYRRFENADVTAMEIAEDSVDLTKLKYPKLLESVSTSASSLNEDLFSKKSFLSDKSLTSLNTSLTADKGFLLDLQLFSEVASSLRNGASDLLNSATPDFFWFRSSALQGVIAEHGSDSSQVSEAVELIKNTIKEIESSFQKIFNDNYVYFVITVDNESDNYRRRRSLLADETASTISMNLYPVATMNLSEEYDTDYPAIFNIIFFVMLIIGLSAFAVALGMWHIDPGRDSIIYRMTSQRIKKEQ